MSLGFALAPLPQASAVAYGLEYAAASDATARHFFAACRAGRQEQDEKRGF